MVFEDAFYVLKRISTDRSLASPPLSALRTSRLPGTSGQNPVAWMASWTGYPSRSQTVTVTLALNPERRISTGIPRASTEQLAQARRLSFCFFPAHDRFGGSHHHWR